MMSPPAHLERHYVYVKHFVTLCSTGVIAITSLLLLGVILSVIAFLLWTAALCVCPKCCEGMKEDPCREFIPGFSVNLFPTSFPLASPGKFLRCIRVSFHEWRLTFDHRSRLCIDPVKLIAGRIKLRFSVQSASVFYCQLLRTCCRLLYFTWLTSMCVEGGVGHMTLCWAGPLMPVSNLFDDKT